jgi:hypothetical protein
MLANKRVLIIGFDPKFLLVAGACAHEPDRREGPAGLAPKARIGFNTKPTDTVETVRRWL